MFVWRETQCSV